MEWQNVSFSKESCYIVYILNIFYVMYVIADND